GAGPGPPRRAPRNTCRSAQPCGLPRGPPLLPPAAPVSVTGAAARPKQSCSGAGPQGAALLDDGLQGVEVAAEGLAARRRQPAGGLRAAADELLVDGDVAL